MSGPEIQSRKRRGKLGWLGDAAEVTVISGIMLVLYSYLSVAYVVEKAVGEKRPRVK